MKLNITLKMYLAIFALLLNASLQAAEQVGTTTAGDLKFDLYNDNTAIVYAGNKSIIDANIPELVSYESKDYKVTAIGDNAFDECKALATLSIPNSVISIGGMAFNACESLTSVVIPNSVTSLGSATFMSCTNLTSITLSDNITEIPGSFLSVCSKLQSIVIPENVTTIKSGAFYVCDALTTVIIGEKVSTIKGMVFYSCPSLREVYSLNPTPPTCDRCFDLTQSSPTLILPFGSKEVYKATEMWKEFKTYADCFEDGARAYTVTITKTGFGTVLVNDKAVENDTLRAGSNVIFKTKGTITKAKLDGVDITSKFVDNMYTLEAINTNTRFEIEFENTPFNVNTVYNDSEASITINNEAVSSASIVAGEKVEFVIIPKGKYILELLTVNDKEVIAQSKGDNTKIYTYTIDKLEEDITLKATFTFAISISSIDAKKVKVYSSSNKIIVENANDEETISISNTNGLNIYTGTYKVVTLNNKGVYIVKVGNTTQKVVIE